MSAYLARQTMGLAFTIDGGKEWGVDDLKSWFISTVLTPRGHQAIPKSLESSGAFQVGNGGGWDDYEWFSRS